uniref:Ubiquinol-cytochrome-c reductase complex assembly factor 3 n=1 Tax=Cyprinodon variegatus TaxID=28743 RepID=A0A3Q2DGX2_CYPVA
MPGGWVVLIRSSAVSCSSSVMGSWAILVNEFLSCPLVHQNLPESNPVRMEETRQRNAMVMQALKDAAETSENLARGKKQQD